MILRLLLVFAILLVIDLYVYQLFKSAFKKSKWVHYGFWLFSLGTFLYILLASSQFDPASTPRKVVNTFMGALMIIYVPKLFMVIALIFQDVVRLLLWGYEKLKNSLVRGEKQAVNSSRRAFVSQLSIGLAALPFSSVLYGVIQGKYDFRVISKKLAIDRLPAEFEGFKILQISDIHSGSFTNREKIAYGVEMILEQKPDVVFFTGDLVNNKASEMDEWKDLFSKINAPHGVFSIFGNHDYGDYISWPSEEAKAKNLEDLADVHRQMGYRLLRNENAVISKGNAQINIAGVENWGYPPFPQHGDLELAMKGVDDSNVTLLLSHDPSHFDGEVKNFSKKIDVTFSGHTHGMQFGIEIPGWIKWSPVQLKYPKWAGLYTENDRHLYVNRGFGYLAFPGRVGIWPEITVLELTAKS